MALQRERKPYEISHRAGFNIRCWLTVRVFSELVNKKLAQNNILINNYDIIMPIYKMQGCENMKIFIYLDECGSIHKNSSTKYFAVGGYFTFTEDKNKITSTYKKINKKIKDEKIYCGKRNKIL